MAAKRERQIKGWSRVKKQMLIEEKLGYNICTEVADVFRHRRVHVKKIQ